MPELAAIRFDPTLPLWLLAAFGAACVLVLALAVFRRARGTLWRALALALLLGWLAGPRLVRETREGLRDIALLVVDETASMQVGDRTAIRDRARREIAETVARMPDVELRTVTVSPGRQGTQLFAAIDRAMADIPRTRLAGIIALTDGQVHDIPSTPSLPAPLHVLIAARGEETDRRIRVVEAPGFGVVGRSVTLRVVIDDLGVDRPGTTGLTVRRDGEPVQHITVPTGREQTIELPITRAGPSVVDLEVDALPGEASPLNNRAVVTINGVRDRLRVLLVSGEPHMGERTWRRLLKADPAVDLVHFTILRPPDRGRCDAAERTGADRIPDARAVPGQDQRIRPDHPRSVPEPRHPADRLSAQHRRLRAAGRGAADERGPGILGACDQPVHIADRCGSAGPARRRGDG